MDADPFVMRLAIASVQQQDAIDNGNLDRSRSLSTSAIGAIRDLFQTVARPDERNPPAFVLGAVCTDLVNEDDFEDIFDAPERDLLAIYPDHILIVRNPARGVSAVGAIGSLFKSFSKKGKESLAAPERYLAQEIKSFSIEDRHFSTGSESLLALTIAGHSLIFWMSTAMDSHNEVEQHISALASASA